ERPQHGRCAAGAGRGRAHELRLDVAYRGQVRLDLATVVGAQALAELVEIAGNEVEDAAVGGALPERLFRIAGRRREQAREQLLRIVLPGDRVLRPAPGH